MEKINEDGSTKKVLRDFHDLATISPVQFKPEFKDDAKIYDFTKKEE